MKNSTVDTEFHADSIRRNGKEVHEVCMEYLVSAVKSVTNGYNLQF